MPGFDLSKWQNAYDAAPTEREEGSREDVPDGKYQARVARVELKDSKNGNAMLEWELDILGPRFAGRKLWRRNMLASADNVKWLKADLYTAGVTLGHINDLNSEGTLRKLIGVALEITKKTKGDYENVYLNKRIAVSGGAAPKPTQQYAPGVSEDDVPF